MTDFLDDDGRWRGITRIYTVVCAGVCFHVLASSAEHAYQRVKESSFNMLPYAVFEGERMNLITAYKTIRL